MCAFNEPAISRREWCTAGLQHTEMSQSTKRHVKKRMPLLCIGRPLCATTSALQSLLKYMMSEKSLEMSVSEGRHPWKCGWSYMMSRFVIVYTSSTNDFLHKHPRTGQRCKEPVVERILRERGSCLQRETCVNTGL